MQLKHIAILRLSALGDVINCLAAARALQRSFPGVKLSWIINRFEYELLRDIDDINWVVVDKSNPAASWNIIRKTFKPDPPDILLHMQAALRASILRTAIKSPRVIGFDHKRSKDYQAIFSHEQIAPRPRRHVLETFLDFAGHIGANVAEICWNLPVENYRREQDEELPSRYIVISPCSSKKIRNISIKTCAEIVDTIYEKYGLASVISGGVNTYEQNYIRQISKLCLHNPIDLAGRTTVRQMAGLIKDSMLLIAPDSGPAHLGAALKIPVIGLYANTDPERARPYGNEKYLVNKYPEAARKYMNKNFHDLPFGARINFAGVMDLITANYVMAKVDLVLSGQQ